MPKYIERKSLIAWLHNMAVSPALIAAIENKERFPAADVVEVVHGEWVDQIGLKKCSCCKTHQIEISNYCPNCGADMRGDKNG